MKLAAEGHQEQEQEQSSHTQVMDLSTTTRVIRQPACSRTLPSLLYHLGGGGYSFT